ncbi:hypothetical protein MJO29_012401 [Puccinia striiformis f. sp. tritici]|nr:hypothetical protein MJO29_012401 [Puccinia striiformis f. sp. tritici]
MSQKAVSMVVAKRSKAVMDADTWPSDPRIFTVVQLRIYLQHHGVLINRPASYHQPELYKLYSGHLANCPRLDPCLFDWPEPAELTAFGLRHILDQYKTSYDPSLRRADLEQLYINLKARQHLAEGDLKRPRIQPSPPLEKLPPIPAPPPPLRARPAWLVKKKYPQKTPLNSKQKILNAPEPNLRRSARIDAARKAKDDSHPSSPSTCNINGKRPYRVSEDNLQKSDTLQLHKRPRHTEKTRQPQSKSLKTRETVQPRSKLPKIRAGAPVTTAKDRPSTHLPTSDFTYSEVLIQKTPPEHTPNSRPKWTIPLFTTTDTGKNIVKNVDTTSTLVTSRSHDAHPTTPKSPGNTQTPPTVPLQTVTSVAKKHLVPLDHLRRSLLTLAQDESKSTKVLFGDKPDQPLNLPFPPPPLSAAEPLITPLDCLSKPANVPSCDNSSVKSLTSDSHFSEIDMIPLACTLRIPVNKLDTSDPEPDQPKVSSASTSEDSLVSVTVRETSSKSDPLGLKESPQRKQPRQLPPSTSIPEAASEYNTTSIPGTSKTCQTTNSFDPETDESFITSTNRFKSTIGICQEFQKVQDRRCCSVLGSGHLKNCSTSAPDSPLIPATVPNTSVLESGHLNNSRTSAHNTPLISAIVLNSSVLESAHLDDSFTSDPNSPLFPATVPDPRQCSDAPNEFQQSDILLSPPPSTSSTESSLEYINPTTLVSTDPNQNTKPASVFEPPQSLGLHNLLPTSTDLSVSIPIDRTEPSGIRRNEHSSVLTPELQSKPINPNILPARVTDPTLSLSCPIEMLLDTANEGPDVQIFSDVTVSKPAEEYLQQLHKECLRSSTAAQLPGPEVHKNQSQLNLGASLPTELSGGEVHQNLSQSNLPASLALCCSSTTPLNLDDSPRSTIGRKARRRLVIYDSDEPESETTNPPVDEPSTVGSGARQVPIGTPTGNHLNGRVWHDPNGKIKKKELQDILKEFKIPFKAADKKDVLIQKYKSLIASEKEKSTIALRLLTTHNDNTDEHNQLPPQSHEAPTVVINKSIPERHQWPDPDGKITAIEIQQIRNILTDSGVAHIASDSRLVLLAKYKLVINSDQPRYNLRPPCPPLLQTDIGAAENNQLPEDQEPFNPNPIFPEEALLSGGAVINSGHDSDLHQTNKSSSQIDLDARSQHHESLNPNARITQCTTMPLPFSFPSQHSQSHTRPAQVASWVSGVFMVNNNNKQEIPVTAETPSQSPSMQQLISTFNTLVQNSTEVAKASIHATKAVAEGLASLSIAIESLGTAPAPAAPTCSPCKNTEKQKVKKQGRKSGDLLDAVRQHAATMFGQCAQNDAYPPPATKEAQRRWITQCDEYDSDDASVISSESEMDLDDIDPSFPYPNGPGHSAATPQAIKIIWRTMCKAGVDSFRPDLSKPMSAYINQFLWDIAIVTFMRLVRSGEYPPLNPELLNQDDVKDAFKDHVQNHLMRIYRENKHWSPEEIVARNKKRRQASRLASLKRWRLQEVLSHPSLIGLVPVIEQCCSDDETDDEFPARPTPRRGSSKIAMRAKVLRLPWRSDQVECIMIGLDRLRARHLEYAVQKPGNPPPRVRRRLEQPQDSSRAHRAGLPMSLYAESWVLSLSTYELQALGSDIQGFPLEAFLQIIENLPH